MAASCLLTLFVPLARWPEWLARASIFDAFGDPYLAVPGWGGLVYLAALAVLGAAAAAAITARRSTPW